MHLLAWCFWPRKAPVYQKLSVRDRNKLISEKERPKHQYWLRKHQERHIPVPPDMDVVAIIPFTMIRIVIRTGTTDQKTQHTNTSCTTPQHLKPAKMPTPPPPDAKISTTA